MRKDYFVAFTSMVVRLGDISQKGGIKLLETIILNNAYIPSNYLDNQYKYEVLSILLETAPVGENKRRDIFYSNLLTD